MKSAHLLQRPDVTPAKGAVTIRFTSGSASPSTRSFTFFLTLISRRVEARHRSCEHIMHDSPKANEGAVESPL